MKKISIVTLILLVTLGVNVLAHPGRLDSKGGHNKKSTNTYHYHYGSDRKTEYQSPQGGANSTDTINENNKADAPADKQSSSDGIDTSVADENISPNSTQQPNETPPNSDEENSTQQPNETPSPTLKSVVQGNDSIKNTTVPTPMDINEHKWTHKPLKPIVYISFVGMIVCVIAFVVVCFRKPKNKSV